MGTYHSKADVGLFERRPVIGSVSCDGYNFTTLTYFTFNDALN